MALKRSVRLAYSGLFVVFTGLVFFAGAQTQAGFEWVPAKNAEPARQNTSPATTAAPAVPTIEVEQESVSILPMMEPQPLLGNDETSAPSYADRIDVVTPEPPTAEQPVQMRTLRPPQAQPQATQAPVAATPYPMAAPQQQIQRPQQPALSARMSDNIETNQLPAAQPRRQLIRDPNFAPSPSSTEDITWSQTNRAPAADPAPSLAPIDITGSAHVNTAPAFGAAPQQAITATSGNTRIVVPEDAPASALEAQRNSAATTGHLVIQDKPDLSTRPSLQPPPDTFSATAAGQQFEEAVGFGSDMPLAYALRQVVPADYAYSFSTSVDPGARVSWTGGKPWNHVVIDMVKPLGLSVGIEGKKVIIYKQAGSAPQRTGSLNTNEASAAPVILAAATENIISNPPTRRLSIQDPGEQVSAQPDESIVRINQIAQTREESEAPLFASASAAEFAALDSIEPAAGDFEQAPAQMQKPVPLLPEDAQAPQLESVEDYKQARFWKGREGQSIKDLLGSWSREANIDLVWNASHDFTLASNVLINDSFDNALQTVVSQSLVEGQGPSITLMETPNKETAATLIIADRRS